MEHEVIKDAVLEILEDELLAREQTEFSAAGVTGMPQAAERIAKYIQSLLKDKVDGKVHQ